MVSGIFHIGSGLGNMLHRYVATRCLALDKGVNFSIVNSKDFKGSSFMNLDMGIEKDWDFNVEYPAGKVMINSTFSLWEDKINYYNPEFNFVPDNTIIDGEFQDERYWESHTDEVDQWLKVEPIYKNWDETCVIGFRGGEFYVFPELGLPKEYFEEAIRKMKQINPDMKFEVHTDDPELAKQFFPDYPIIHDIGINWRSMRYAKYAIIANSSFYILPRWLRCQPYMGFDFTWVNTDAVTIAPRFWARRNTGEWSMPQNYYKRFTYI